MGTTIDDIECRDRQYQLLVPRQVCNVLSKPIKTPITLKEGTRSNKCNPWTKEPTGPLPKCITGNSLGTMAWTSNIS